VTAPSRCAGQENEALAEIKSLEEGLAAGKQASNNIVLITKHLKQKVSTCEA
jgi:hypothetical protein